MCGGVSSTAHRCCWSARRVRLGDGSRHSRCDVVLCCAAGSASSAALITHAAEDATVLNPLRSQVVLEETAADESPTGSSDCSMLPMISSTVVEKSSAIKVMGVDGWGTPARAADFFT